MSLKIIQITEKNIYSVGKNIFETAYNGITSTPLMVEKLSNESVCHAICEEMAKYEHLTTLVWGV